MDLGAIEEDVPFDFGVAEALIASCKAAASAVDGQLGPRASWVRTALADFRGVFAELFGSNAAVAAGDANELSSRLHDVAFGAERLADEARREQQRRETARAWKQQHDRRVSASSWVDRQLVDDDPPVGPPAAPVSIPVAPASARPRQNPAPGGGRGRGGSTTSARPADLRTFASGSRGANGALRPLPARLEQAYQDFRWSCRWGSLDADGVFLGFRQWLMANDADVTWATVVANAFARAGSAGSVSTLADSAVTAALRSRHVDASRHDLVVEPPQAYGAPPTTGYADDPVNTATGNFLEVETDLAFPGAAAGLLLSRCYNSFDTGQHAFGPGWSSVCEAGLSFDDGLARFTLPDGRQVHFPRLGDGWDRALGENLWLAADEESEDLLVSGNDGTWWRFSAAGSLLAFGVGPVASRCFVTVERDASGRVVRLDHARGAWVELAWADDLVVSAASSDGRLVAYTYDDGWLVSATSGSGSRAYRWDGDRIAAVVDADGVVEVENSYDARGRVVAQRSPFGRTTRYAYLPGRVTVVSDEDGTRSNTWIHDDRGRLVGVVDAHEQRQSTTYDRWGNRVRVTERDGATTVHEHDERGRLVRTVTASGAELTYGYDDLDRVTTVVAEAGAVTTYTYAGAERNPSVVLDPEGGRTRLTWRDGLLTQVVDPTGVVVRFGYDERGDLVAITNADGATARLERDAVGRVTAAVTPSGHRTGYVYDPTSGRLTERHDPDGAVWAYAWSAAGRLVATVDPLGRRTAIERGPHGEETATVDALGRVVRRELDDLGNLAATVLPDGSTWRFAHDALSRLVATTDPTGATWRRQYDRAGHPTARVDPTGVSTRPEPVEGPCPEPVEGPRPEPVERPHPEPVGGPHPEPVDSSCPEPVEGPRPEPVEGPRPEPVDPSRPEPVDSSCPEPVEGQRPEPAEGPRPEPAEGPRPEPADSSCPEPVEGPRPEPVDPSCPEPVEGPRPEPVDPSCPAPVEGPCPEPVEGPHPEPVDPSCPEPVEGPCPELVEGPCPEPVEGPLISFDTLGRLTSLAQPDGSASVYTYDRCGRVVEALDPDGGLTRIAHDAAGRPFEVTSPLGAVTRYTYDTCGRLVSVIDPSGALTRVGYDVDSRPVTQTLPTGEVARTAYDACGRVVSHRVPGVGTSRWVYDLAGRVVESEGPQAGRRRFRYDAAGQLVAVVDGVGAAMTYAYDELGRATVITDPLGGVTRRAFDAMNRCVAETDPLGRTTRAGYDAAGRLAWQQSPDGRRTAWTYDSAGRVAGTSVDGRLVTALTRDLRRRTVRIGDDSGERHVEHELAWNRRGQLVRRSRDGRSVTWSYDADGRRTSMTTPDGTITAYGWDAAGRLVSVDSSVLGRAAFDRDAAGRLVAARADSLVQTWEHRDGFVVGHTVTNGGGSTRTRISRDDGGRVTRVTNASGSTDYAYDGAHQLVEARTPTSTGRWRYDLAGRLVAESVSDVSVSHVYDAAGQLLSTLDADGRQTRYTYDRVGRRTCEDDGDQTREFVWNPSGYLAGVLRRRGDRVHRTKVHSDALGELASVDGTELFWDTAAFAGAPVLAGDVPILSAGPLTGIGAGWAAPGWRTDRSTDADPWAGAAGTSLGALSIDAAGGLSVDGLEWMGARVFDPTARGFLSVDPLDHLTAGLSANPYAFAGNDPVHALDPLGLSPVTDAQLAEYRSNNGLAGFAKNNWEYVAGGAAIVGGIALMATGVGGPLGLMLISAGTDTIIQKATTGQVNWGEVAVAGVAGGVGGGVGAAVGRVAGEGLLSTVAVGAASGGAEGAVNGGGNYLLGSGPHTVSGLVGSTATGAAVGELTGGAGGATAHGAAQLGGRLLSRVSSTGCFIAGTEVLMADGSSKQVEKVEPEDEVLAYDPESATTETRRVVRVFAHPGKPTYDVEVEDGSKVTATSNHPFMVDGMGYTPADELEHGDLLVQPDGSTVAVQSVNPTGSCATVYNLEVEGLHNYYVRAGDHWLLVHNDCGVGGDLLVEARAARDNLGEQMRGLPRWRERPAVFVGAYDEGSGDVRAFHSAVRGPHAEEVARSAMPNARLTEPMGWRGTAGSSQESWTRIPVCGNCQDLFPASLFPGGTEASPGGRWGR